VEKLTWVHNNTGDGSSITCTAGAGSTVTVLSGFIACVYSDGATNVAALFNMAATVSGQIKFPATQNASADANTLDDYEEGSWTPGVAFGGASVGITYAVQSANYLKIGNRCWVVWRVVLTSKGSSTGTATVTGLPFTQGEFQGPPSLGYHNINLDTAGGYYSPYAFLATTTVVLHEQGDNVAPAQLTDVDFANNSEVYGSTNYLV
jgi:hypothetical protein